MGGACDHNKAHGLSLFPHQSKICTKGLLGRHALGMLGRTLLISLEGAVCDSDATIHSEDSSVSTLSTPLYQKQTSKRALSDYIVYFISASAISKAPVILITKVKKFNDDFIVQAIGNYIASRESVSGRHGSLKPPLAVVFCQNEVRFILFPFRKDIDELWPQTKQQLITWFSSKSEKRSAKGVAERKFRQSLSSS